MKGIKKLKLVIEHCIHCGKSSSHYAGRADHSDFCPFCDGRLGDGKQYPIEERFHFTKCSSFRETRTNGPAEGAVS